MGGVDSPTHSGPAPTRHGEGLHTVRMEPGDDRCWQPRQPGRPSMFPAFRLAVLLLRPLAWGARVPCRIWASLDLGTFCSLCLKCQDADSRKPSFSGMRTQSQAGAAGWPPDCLISFLGTFQGLDAQKSYRHLGPCCGEQWVPVGTGEVARRKTRSCHLLLAGRNAWLVPEITT